MTKKERRKLRRNKKRLVYRDEETGYTIERDARYVYERAYDGTLRRYDAKKWDEAMRRMEELEEQWAERMMKEADLRRCGNCSKIVYPDLKITSDGFCSEKRIEGPLDGDEGMDCPHFELRAQSA